MTSLKSIALVFGVASVFASCAEAKEGFAVWEPAIAKFEAADAEEPPPQEAILFVGSSSIRLWDLSKFFRGMETINRGFGGSEIEDSTHFAERIVLKHSPRVVVLYAGDNDISAGKSAETVLADFQAFVAKVHEGLPNTKIVFIAIKPSIARWHFADTNRQANALIASECQNNELLEFADIWEAMLQGKEGPPPAGLFAADGLHLSHKGYRIWALRLKPLLK